MNFVLVTSSWLEEKGLCMFWGLIPRTAYCILILLFSWASRLHVIMEALASSLLFTETCNPGQTTWEHSRVIAMRLCDMRVILPNTSPKSHWHQACWRFIPVKGNSVIKDSLIESFIKWTYCQQNFIFCHVPFTDLIGKAAVKHLVLGGSLVKKRSMAQTLGDLRQTNNWWLTNSSLSVLLQPSKRSAADLCGRNDGNLKVIFADVEMEDATDSRLRVRAQPGDYVLVKVRGSFCAFDLHFEMGVGLDNLREWSFFFSGEIL